jgi:hypothetical protein
MSSSLDGKIRQQSNGFAALKGNGRAIQLDLRGTQKMQGETCGHASPSLKPEIISPKFTQYPQKGHFETLSETDRRRAIRKLGQVQPIQKEKE